VNGLAVTNCVGDDFEHPAVPEGDPLRPHCLYRLTQAEWRQRQPTMPPAAFSSRRF